MFSPAPLFRGFTCDSADFDGTNDYMTRGAGLTGAADSKLFSLVQWFRVDGGDGATRYLFADSTTLAGAVHNSVSLTTGNVINITFRNAASSLILGSNTTETFAASSTWQCLLLSVDLVNSSNRAAYIGNTALTMSWGTYTNDTIDFTKADWSIAAQPNGSNKLNGCLGPTWFMIGTQLAFGTESVRRLFINAAGKPVFLGTDGSRPTGGAPIVYQNIGHGEAVANFATNRGSGGNFSITGTLDTGSSSPSD